MRLSNLCFVVAMSVFLFTSNEGVAQDVQIPLDDEFVEGALTSDSESPVLYDYRWDVFGVDGYVVLCGAGYLREIRVRSFVRNILRDAVLYANDTPIMQDLTFFNSLSSARRLETGEATCRISNVEIPSGDLEFYLDFGGGRRFRM